MERQERAQTTWLQAYHDEFFQLFNLTLLYSRSCLVGQIVILHDLLKRLNMDYLQPLISKKSYKPLSKLGSAKQIITFNQHCLQPKADLNFLNIIHRPVGLLNTIEHLCLAFSELWRLKSIRCIVLQQVLYCNKNKKYCIRTQGTSTYIKCNIL